MAYFTGTLLASPIVRGSSGDTYGTHHSILGVGGFMEVNSISERNALPIDSVNGLYYDGISSGQRRIGMLVYVHDDDTTYKLNIDKSAWSGLTTNQKLTELSDNANWEMFIAGGDDTPIGDRILKQFEQTTHGFVVGDVIGYDGTEFVKVSSLTAGDIEPLGIVTKIIDVNTFNLTYSGYVPNISFDDVNSNPISGGSVYYLSSTAGKITPTNPISTTELSKPVLVGLSGNSVMVLQYRGIYELTTGSTYVLYSNFTGYTATTKVILDATVTGATNIGYFSGLTGVQSLPINHLTNNFYDGDYISRYNYYYRDNQGYIRIGTPSDGIPKRAYLRSSPTPISWIWNEYTGDGPSVGWIFVEKDVTLDSVYGTRVTGNTNIGYSTPLYTNVGWTNGVFYNNGSSVVIGNVEGSLNTGTTFVETGPIYRDKLNRNLRLRTIKSNTPENLTVEYDDYFIKLSGRTDIVGGKNVGNGIDVLSGTSGNTLFFKTLVGDGATSVTDDGDTITISSTGGGGSSVTSGENVTKRIIKNSHGFIEGDVVGWSNGTYSKAIADGNYDGEIIGIVSEVVNSNTFDVTQSGFITGMTTNLTPNTTYFVSSTSFGGMTSTPPTTVGYIIRPIFIATNATSGWVLPYIGTTITEPITGTTEPLSLFYTGATPSNVTVGALNAGTTLTGKTLSEIFEQMLITTYTPTYVAPSSTFTENAATTYEYGCVINIDFEATLDRGSIDLDGSFQNYRSGVANCYYYTGPGLPSTVSSTALSDDQSISNFTISADTTTWDSCVGYDEGPQPLDSNGDPYDSPLPSGITSPIERSVNGLYPYYFGTVASGGAPAGSNRPSATNSLVTGGTKVLQDSNGTIDINFSSTSDDYLWFAIPSGSTSKTCWYINALNNGDIGGGVSPACNLFPAFDPEDVCSAQGCWNDVPYKVYISNYQSAVSTTMEIRNS